MGCIPYDVKDRTHTCSKHTYDISSRYLQKLIMRRSVREKAPAAYLSVYRASQIFLATCQPAQDAKHILITQGGPGASGVGYGNFEVSP